MDTEELRTMIREDVQEIKSIVKDITLSVNDLRLLIVAHYATKEELEKIVEQNEAEHDQILEKTHGLVPAWVTVILPMFTAVISGMLVHVLAR
ncbi:MAG: hypothetical protein LBT32_03600 [Peptococcaceae bacterium]|jgi:hypothetical protein|nr:hypothetical protein [Peptococcaceae bacterium]